MQRPVLRRGDVVEVHRSRKHKFTDTPAHVLDSRFVVWRMEAPDRIERRRLRWICNNSSDGATKVTVRDKRGGVFEFNRRDLWKVPNANTLELKHKAFIEKNAKDLKGQRK